MYNLNGCFYFFVIDCLENGNWDEVWICIFENVFKFYEELWFDNLIGNNLEMLIDGNVVIY